MSGSKAFGPLLPFRFGLACGETGMPTDRVQGRFVAEGEPERQDRACEEVRRAAPRPAHCKRFAKARFAEALPEVMRTLLEQVKNGSVPHLKVVLELTGLDKDEAAPRRSKPKEKTLEQILLEQWRKDDEEERARNAAVEAAPEQANGTDEAVP